MILPITQATTRSVFRPYQIFPDKKLWSDISWTEFLFANCVLLEKLVNSHDRDIHGFASHMTFMCPKYSQNYTAKSIMEYDENRRKMLEMSSEAWPKDCDGHLMNCVFLRQGPIQTPGPAGNISSNRYRQRGSNSNWGSGNHKICYRWNEQGMQGCRGCKLCTCIPNVR